MELEGLSLTKGCLAITPKKVSHSSVNFLKHPSETVKDAQRRSQKYQKCLREIRTKMDDLVRGFEEDYCNDIKEFVTSLSCDMESSLTRIPTCVFNGCFDVSVNLFTKLEEALASVTPLIVNIQTYTNMKATMKDIFQQLLSHDEEEYTGSIPDCSISTICQWYKSYCDDNGKTQPVILIMEYIEDIPLSILSDLLIPIHSRLQDFPVILLLGVRAVHNAAGLDFPPSLLSVLKWDKIIKDPLHSVIPQTLEMMCFDPSFGFHFTPSFCKSLIEGFEGQLVPIANLKKSIEFYLLEHFYWQPLSFLCDSISAGTIRKDVKALSCDQVEIGRASSSMMRYIELADMEERIALLQDANHLKTKVEECITKIHSYYHSLRPAVNTLHLLLNGKTTTRDELATLKMLLSYLTENQGKDFYLQALRVMNEKTFQSNVSAAITYVGTYSKLSSVCTALKNCLSQSKDGKLTGNHITTVIDHLLQHVYCPTTLTLHEAVCYNGNKRTPYHIL